MQLIKKEKNTGKPNMTCLCSIISLLLVCYVHLVNICVRACDSNEYKSEASVIIFLFAYFEQSQEKE